MDSGLRKKTFPTAMCISAAAVIFLRGKLMRYDIAAYPQIPVNMGFLCVMVCTYIIFRALTISQRNPASQYKISRKRLVSLAAQNVRRGLTAAFVGQPIVAESSSCAPVSPAPPAKFLFPKNLIF
jgi:hypothetical protein